MKVQTVGRTLIGVACAAALAAPFLAPAPADQQWPELLNAPPTIIHLRDARGWRLPFIYKQTLLNRLEQRYQEDQNAPVPLTWFAEGHLLHSSDSQMPLLLLGADSFGRDVFSRLLYAARISLALSLLAAFGALVIGGAIGGAAGFAGGFVDDALMRAADVVVVLPATYVALAMRSALPQVLSTAAVFTWLLGIFAILGAPIVARGVRAIVQAEKNQDYSVAAQSLGNSRTRVLVKHLLPAARGYLLVQMTLLVPAFIIAEATLSYVGFGFPEPTATWGTMLREGAGLGALSRFPWLLSPGVAIFMLTLGVNLWLYEQGDRTEYTRYN